MLLELGRPATAEEIAAQSSVLFSLQSESHFGSEVAVYPGNLSKAHWLCCTDHSQLCEDRTVCKVGFYHRKRESQLTLSLRVLHLSQAFEGLPRNTIMSLWVHCGGRLSDVGMEDVRVKCSACISAD